MNLRGWMLCLLLLAVGCGPGMWSGRGVVLEIKPEAHEVVIDHQEIEGLMEAMSMSFHAEAAVLERMEVGREIEFTLRQRGGRYEVVEFHVAGAGG